MNDEFKTMIGNKVYCIRMENKLTQDEFSQKLGIYITRGHISKIENGLIMPSAEFVAAVCSTFSVSPIWLLNLSSPNLSISEQLLLKLFNSLSKDTQDLILSLLKKLT